METVAVAPPGTVALLKEPSGIWNEGLSGTGSGTHIFLKHGGLLVVGLTIGGSAAGAAPRLLPLSDAVLIHLSLSVDPKGLVTFLDVSFHNSNLKLSKNKQEE